MYIHHSIPFSIPAIRDTPQFWLVWVEVCWSFLESQHRQIYCSWGQMCVLACRLELKWSQDKPIRKVFVCVCWSMMWSDWGWSFGEVANFYFSWGTKMGQYVPVICNGIWRRATQAHLQAYILNCPLMLQLTSLYPLAIRVPYGIILCLALWANVLAWQHFHSLYVSSVQNTHRSEVDGLHVGMVWFNRHHHLKLI